MVIDDKSTAINALIDAVTTIERVLGITPFGVYSDVRVRLDILEARINNPNFPAPNVTNPFYIDGYSGVSISTGDGYPTEIRVDGSLYIRRDGYTYEGIYARRDGAWELIPSELWLAGGDLSGDYNSQNVVGIQGYPVSTDIPGDGYVLSFNSGTWNPTAGGAAPGGSATGDLGGTYPAPTVTGIRGRPVSSATPLDGYILAFNSSSGAWTPTVHANTAGSTGPTGSGSTGPTGTSGSSWTILIPSTDFETSSQAGGYTIKISNTVLDLGTITSGIGIRILDKHGVDAYSESFGTVGSNYSYNTITGITDSLLQPNGNLRFQYYEITTGFYKILIHQPTNFGGPILIGHSDSFEFNTPTSINILPDNSSGLGGNIYVNNVPDGYEDFNVEFYKWYTVGYITADVGFSDVILDGPLISTVSGDIASVAYASPERTILLPLLISGSYISEVHTNGLLRDFLKMYPGLYWSNPQARLTKASFVSNAVTATGANQPLLNIDLDGGLFLSSEVIITTAQVTYRSVASNINPYNTTIGDNFEGYLDIVCFTSGGYDSTSADLYISLTFVLE